MAPLRRYLRITPYSVLEVRIYLDQPADLHRWLLRPQSSSSSTTPLQRIFTAIRPLILPKLREETSTSSKPSNGKRKKGWKDTVLEPDFEVALFLTETSARHAILRKEKRAKSEKGDGMLGTVGGKMTGAGGKTVEEAVVVVDREDDEEGAVELGDVPLAKDAAAGLQEKEKGEEERSRRSSSREGLFVSSDDEDAPRSERLEINDDDDGVDDKKKMGLHTTYDGFSIYGRILCLVVKRRGTHNSTTAKGKEPAMMMEEWISSTQQMGEEGRVMMDE